MGNHGFGTASVARVRWVGKRTRVEQVPGDLDRFAALVARGPAQDVEGGDRIDAVGGHEEADTSVDDDAVVEANCSWSAISPLCLARSAASTRSVGTP